MAVIWDMACTFISDKSNVAKLRIFVLKIKGEGEWKFLVVIKVISDSNYFIIMSYLSLPYQCNSIAGGIHSKNRKCETHPPLNFSAYFIKFLAPYTEK